MKPTSPDLRFFYFPIGDSRISAVFCIEERTAIYFVISALLTKKHEHVCKVAFSDIERYAVAPNEKRTEARVECLPGQFSR